MGEHVTDAELAQWDESPLGGEFSPREVNRKVRALVAVVRFLSCEPLLEAVDVSNSGIDWIIVGGESGRGARDFHLDWADDIVKQCRGIGAAPFVKQMGAVPFNGDERFPLRDSHGGDWDEWPAELRVREFPQLRRLVGR